MLSRLRSDLSSPPPNAFLIKCALRFSSRNAHEPASLFSFFMLLPSTPIDPDVVGTRSASLDFRMVPFKPERCPPTRLTTSSEESSSQRPSVARTMKRSVDFESVESESTLEEGEGRNESFRCVTTGRAIT